MGILEGKNILVAGVTLDTSIGFHVAKIAQAEGATVVVSNFGRAMSLTGSGDQEARSGAAAARGRRHK